MKIITSKWVETPDKIKLYVYYIFGIPFFQWTKKPTEWLPIGLFFGTLILLAIATVSSVSTFNLQLLFYILVIFSSFMIFVWSRLSGWFEK